MLVKLPSGKGLVNPEGLLVAQKDFAAIELYYPHDGEDRDPIRICYNSSDLGAEYEDDDEEDKALDELAEGDFQAILDSLT